MAYAPDLGSGGATREGSSPSSRTKPKREIPMNITSYVEESPTKRSLSLEVPLEEVREAERLDGVPGADASVVDLVNEPER